MKWLEARKAIGRFDEGEAYEWEMKRELKEEDSVRLMRMMRRLMDEGPMYY